MQNSNVQLNGGVYRAEDRWVPNLLQSDVYDEVLEQ